MSRSTTAINRRTVLRGAGVACALPWLEAMSKASATGGGGAKPAPTRACFVYVPNGVGLPPAGDPAHQDWHWFPHGEGADYKFTKVLEPLAPHRQQLSILGGYSHPNSRALLGHLAGDTWLTGGDLRGSSYANTISADQVAADAIGRSTRYRSLVLSSDGGVGYKSRIATLSFDSAGRPIPAEHRQRAIFERYFRPQQASSGQQGGQSDTGPSDERRKAMARNKKIVDLVMGDAKAMGRAVGRADQRRLDEYLEAVSSVEEQIRRNERWLDTPITLPGGDPLTGDMGIDMNVTANVDPTAYLRAMFDLMVLAFRTDLTRVATFMMAREDGMGFGENFPKLAVGIGKGHHSISHDKSKGHWEEWGAYDRWLAEQLAYFVGRLKQVEDESGPMLNRTLVLYGSACSTTHNAINYPTVLAGGSALGLRHGRYLRSVESTAHGHDEPMANVLLTMLQAAGAPLDQFADSTGPVEPLLASS